MKYSLFVLFLALSSLVFSEEKPVDSEFQLDKNLVDRLYKESVEENKSSFQLHSSATTFAPALNFFSPEQMNLKNDYFEVPYSDSIGTVPGVSLTASSKLFNWEGLYITGLGGVGYSMKDAVQSVTSRTASVDAIRTTKLTLHRLPLSLGARMEYRFSGFESVRPFAQMKAGAQWLYQVGQLDGIEQGFWIPFYEYGGGLTLLDAPSSPDRWFGGFNIGLFKSQSFSSDQVVSGTTFEFGMNILL